MSLNLLKNTKTYLVGNLESTEDAHKWREWVETALGPLNIYCFNPNKIHFLNQPSENEDDINRIKIQRSNGEWDKISTHMKSVIRKDLRFIDLASFIIGNIEPSKPTFGTIHEIVKASEQRKPILLHVKNKNEFPLWLSGLVNMDLVWENWDNLINYLYDINSGKIYADPKYWKILQEDWR